MIFLSLIAVLALVHWTNVGSILQRDTWFVFALNKFRALPSITSIPLLPMALFLATPLVGLVVAIWAIVHFLDAAFLFFLYIPVLLYSLGRGNFIAEVGQYIEMATRGDNVSASKWVSDMRGHAELDAATDNVGDWKTLHTEALRVISYRGFERTFAVLFWFVIAGALGALLYRLSVIYREQTEHNTSEAQWADKWLWLIELPAVRLMGMTWAFVGNFDTCPWRTTLLDTEHSSIEILNNSLRGALSAPTDVYIAPASSDVEQSIGEADSAEHANEEAQEVLEDLVGIAVAPQVEPAYSFALVKSSIPLYSRSLLFWVGAIAFSTLFI